MSVDVVCSAFRERFGIEPEIVVQAPGRVNLIGEHTDTNEGLVFPAAIDRFVWVAASKSDQPAFVSLDMPESEQGWLQYPSGVAWAFGQRGYTWSPGADPANPKPQLPGLRAVVTGNVPIGAGLSSSAAIEMAFAVAWNELGGLGLEKMELARIGQECENGFIGLSSGIMDQAASMFGVKGHALLIDTFTLEIEPVPLPEGLAIVVADTGTRRELANSRYNERRQDSAKAAEALGVRALRHTTLAELEDAADLMSDVAYRRARHVISEIGRCRKFSSALQALDLPEIGGLMRQSHASLRDDYEASTPELDAMADACNHAPGCVGARMTGAGWGGACVALVHRAQMEEFVREASEEYRAASGRQGSFLACEAADGARRVA